MNSIKVNLNLITTLTSARIIDSNPNHNPIFKIDSFYYLYKYIIYEYVNGMPVLG
jgi:hypothetical protein